MTYNPKIHNRKSIRLKGYDYSQAGLYFVTICIRDRQNLFGEIINNKMILNNAGKNAEYCWFEIPNHFPNTILHEYIAMPNHIHGIIEIIVGAKNISPNNIMNDDSYINNRTIDDSPLPKSPSKTIGSIVRGYKIGVTKWFREYMGNEFPIGKSVWQRNYHEHIVRNEQSYQRISKYIINNPENWNDDKFFK